MHVLLFSESLIRLQLVQQMFEVAQCCSERHGRFQSAIYVWVLPVVVKLLCDCNGEVCMLSLCCTVVALQVIFSHFSELYILEDARHISCREVRPGM